MGPDPTGARVIKQHHFVMLIQCK